MPLVRMLVSWGPPAWEVKDRLSNTLYFNVSGSVDEPDYQDLANDLRDIYLNQVFTRGGKVEVRAYNMDDDLPRPEKAYSTGQAIGTWPAAVPQAALALSYYSDRNLPRRRGRIFTGPQAANPGPRAAAAVCDALRNFGEALGGLGGLNVDWSVYSPTNEAAGQPSHYRISNIWVDDSYDVVRSRKLDSTYRAVGTING